MRVAGRDVRDQRLAPRFGEGLEAALDARHQSFFPERSATVCMSLSPRPERLTSRLGSSFIDGALLIAWALACADSSAGMMPALRQSSWKAARASSSVTATYSARFESL